jgi:hypothetical protein
MAALLASSSGDRRDIGNAETKGLEGATGSAKVISIKENYFGGFQS